MPFLAGWMPGEVGKNQFIRMLLKPPGGFDGPGVPKGTAPGAPGVPSRCPLPVAGAGAGGLVALSAAVRAISIPEPRLHPLNKKQTRN